MSDPCLNALPCLNATEQIGEMPVSVGTPPFMSITHTQNINQQAIILGVTYDLNKFDRQFVIHSSGISILPTGYFAQTKNGLVRCGSSGGSKDDMLGGISEKAESTNIVPMYLNMKDDLFVYKKVQEKVEFSSSKSDKIIFRGMFGMTQHIKLVVTKEGEKEHLQGTEEFHIVYKGVDTVVYSSEYDFNPFPEISGLNTWGFYGGAIHKTVDGESFDPSIRQLFVYPNPGSLAIPQADNIPSVYMYGFYDYGEVEAGLIKGTRATLDGGMDYWYPEWIRHMTRQPILESFAEERAAAIFDKYVPPNGDWYAPAPETYKFPFGSFVQDLNGNYIHSCIFTDRKLQHIIYNNSNLNDVFNSILNLGQTLHGGEAVFFPITIISSTSEPTTVEGLGATSDPNLVTDENGLAITDVNNEVIYA